MNKNSAIVSRLKELRKNIGMNQTQFADAINMKQGSYSSVETGVNQLTDKNISLICVKFGVSEMWLRTGKGDMFELNKSTHKEGRLIELYRGLSPRAQDLLIEYAEKLINDEQILMNGNQLKKDSSA